MANRGFLKRGLEGGGVGNILPLVYDDPSRRPSSYDDFSLMEYLLSSLEEESLLAL